MWAILGAIALSVFTASVHTEECGKPAIQGIRVVAGQTAVRGSWPWQLLMVYKGHHRCGATLIASKWVVTAAHCIYNREWDAKNFKIRVGEFDRKVEEGTEEEYQVERIFRHYKYNPFTTDSDIALFKLTTPVKYNKYVSPVCLPSREPPVGTQCYVTGWGATNASGRMSVQLQQGKQAVVSNRACYDFNKKAYPQLSVTPSMLCAGDGGKTAISGCHGDSGGPFVCLIDDRWELHGAVSHGSKDCNSKGSYSVYARVFYFKKFIESMMKASP